jgi:hypothetical protein
LLLTLCMLVWAQAGLATIASPGHGSQCKAHMSQAAHAAAAATAMPADCCPGHGARGRKSASSPAALPFVLLRSDCCHVDNQPVAPTPFVAARLQSLSLEMRAAQLTRSAIIPSSSAARGLWMTESPPFPQAVFDKKTDRRI